MSYSCKYSRDDYDYVIELSESECKEILEIKAQLTEKKKELIDLLEMYRKLEPSRVYKTPKQIDLDAILNL